MPINDVRYPDNWHKGREGRTSLGADNKWAALAAAKLTRQNTQTTDPTDSRQWTPE